jgi:hypothetical protein
MNFTDLTDDELLTKLQMYEYQNMDELADGARAELKDRGFEQAHVKVKNIE